IAPFTFGIAITRCVTLLPSSVAHCVMLGVLGLLVLCCGDRSVLPDVRSLLIAQARRHALVNRDPPLGSFRRPPGMKARHVHGEICFDLAHAAAAPNSSSS